MEQLTFFPQDFPASHSLSQEKEKAAAMIASSGQKLSELLQKSGPAGSCLRTLLGSSPSWSPRVYHRWKPRRLSFFVRTTGVATGQSSSDYSDELSEQSWTRSAQQDTYAPGLPMALQSCCVFQLAPWEPHTAGTGSGLLPTPTTMDHLDPKSDQAISREMNQVRPGRKQLSNLRDVVVRQPHRVLLPTPIANQGHRKLSENGRCMDKKGNSFSAGLEQLARAGLLPTPTATSDHKGGCTRPDPKRQADSLAHCMHGILGNPGKTSHLNPRFVGQMMGYPPGWLASPFQDGAGSASAGSATQ